MEQITILIILILIVIAALIMIGYRRVLKMEDRIDSLEKVLLVIKKDTDIEHQNGHIEMISPSVKTQNMEEMFISQKYNDGTMNPHMQVQMEMDNMHQDESTDDNISIHSLSNTNDEDDIESSTDESISDESIMSDYESDNIEINKVNHTDNYGTGEDSYGIVKDTVEDTVEDSYRIVKDTVENVKDVAEDSYGKVEENYANIKDVNDDYDKADGEKADGDHKGGNKNYEDNVRKFQDGIDCNRDGYTVSNVEVNDKVNDIKVNNEQNDKGALFLNKNYTETELNAMKRTDLEQICGDLNIIVDKGYNKKVDLIRRIYDFQKKKNVSF